MNKPLFYKSVVPLNRDTHRTTAIDGEMRFAFAAENHLLPAVVDEFPVACASLPILFAQDLNGVAPVFLTGLVPGRNAFVGADGTWTGPYVPAYLRRYPFILGEVPDGEPLVCLDDQADGLAPASSGVPLFDADGGDTDLLRARIRLVTDYAAAATRTQAMTKSLTTLGLLQPITVQNKTVDGSTAIHGLLAVDEATLNGLPDADFLKLRVDGVLAAIYTHLVSLRAIERMPV